MHPSMNGYHGIRKAAYRPRLIAPKQEPSLPRKSVVQVRFLERNRIYPYYNDAFDLHRGDIVYVDGKLKGLRGRVRGRVEEVIYTFKVKLPEYKRVLAVVDTNVKGRFFIREDDLITFDPGALPYATAQSWLIAPEDDEGYVSGSDGFSFRLDDLSGMGAKPDIVERGREYFEHDRVAYLCVSGTSGRAIVRGDDNTYRLEFTFQKGEISELLCDCLCCYTCKHEYAAMLKLGEIWGTVTKFFYAHYRNTKYFAAVNKQLFYKYALEDKESGSIALE